MKNVNSRNFASMSFPFHLIDLTHTLTPDIPSWHGHCGFQHQIKSDYGNGSIKFRTQELQLDAGIGTHMDAPLHCIPRAKCIADLTLSDLAAPCVVIDVSAKAHESYLVTAQDIYEFESKNGHIPPKAFVIIYTGWDQFWSNSNKYRNNLMFPSVSSDAVLALLQKDIVGLGIDTLSPDRGDSGFPVHQLLLENGKYIVENIANAGSLPAMGAYSLALPLKIKDCTESPIRLIACLP